MFRDRRTTAFQEFLVDAKQLWMTDIYGALKQDYRARANGRRIERPEQVAQLLEGTPLYACYAWLERHIQRAKYSGRWGMLAHFADQPQPTGAALGERLVLDDTVAVPDYYAAVDTHQHPGNLHGNDAAGRVYKASAFSTQPGATRGYALHERFAELVAGHGAFERILDMGCGFGKSSLPLAQRFPRATVEGIDLSAPCLKLAADEAAEAQARNLTYRQMDLCHAGYEAGAFDLVTSTMVLHELDPPHVQEALAESWRLLQPGGVAIHLDFQVADPFLAFIHHGHAQRNNEPYMAALNRTDMRGALQDAGFEAIAIAPFEEREGALDPDFAQWRFPWTLFVARKPAAAP